MSKKSKTIRANWNYNKDERDNRNKLLSLFKELDQKI